MSIHLLLATWRDVVAATESIFFCSLICVFTLDRIGRRVTLFWGTFHLVFSFFGLLLKRSLTKHDHAQAARFRLSRSSWRASSSTFSPFTPKRRLSTEVLLPLWCSLCVKKCCLTVTDSEFADRVFLLQYTATFGATCEKSRRFFFERNEPDLCFTTSYRKGSPYPGSTP